MSSLAIRQQRERQSKPAGSSNLSSRQAVIFEKSKAEAKRPSQARQTRASQQAGSWLSSFLLSFEQAAGQEAAGRLESREAESSRPSLSKAGQARKQAERPASARRIHQVSCAGVRELCPYVKQFC